MTMRGLRNWVPAFVVIGVWIPGLFLLAADDSPAKKKLPIT